RPSRSEAAVARIMERFRPDRRGEWNACVRKSKNATFLFDRAYVDYHQDRFLDHSLIVRDGKGWLALLPAHESGTSLTSHGGLTYGGFATDSRMTLVAMQQILDAVIEYLPGHGFDTLIY